MTKRLTTNFVGPDGPLNSKRIWIGEAPGEEEDGVGIPFVGEAGQLFNRCLASEGYIRSEELVWNAFSQRPPGNSVGYFFQDKSCTRPTWEGEEHIECLRLWLENQTSGNLIIALGAVPMRILTGKKRINKWRGSVLPCTLVPGYKVYPTYHPSYVNRLMNEMYEHKLAGEKKQQSINALPTFLLDLQRIRIQSQFPEIRVPERSFEITLSSQQIIERLDQMTRDKVDSAVDIETLPDSSGPLLWWIGFSSDPARAFSIPFITNQRFAWSLSEEVQIVKAISRYFLSDGLKIFQGGGYDLAVVGRYLALRLKSGTYADTMWCHQANYPYIRKGLANLASIYTWESYYKDDGKVHFGKRRGDAAEGIYNCRDVCVTREIWPIVRRDAGELGTWEAYRKTVDNAPGHLAMTLRGVRIDTEKKTRLTQEFTKIAEDHNQAVQGICDYPVNLNSYDQKRKLLYGYLGLKIQYDRSSGKATTDKGALQKLSKQYREGTPGGDIVRHILEYQKFRVLATAYAEMELGEDGRARTSYGYVSTFRTNSSGSPFIFDLAKKKQAGSNLQQIPKHSEEGNMIRKLFIPDEGRVMVAADLSQAEARVVAYEAEDLAKIDLFQAEGVDVHWEYAKEIFDIPKSVKYLPYALFKDKYTGDEHELKDYRRLGKTIRHATNYETGPYKFQATLLKEGFHFEYATCKKLLSAAKNKDPMLAQWKRGVRDRLKADGFLISSIGDKRYTQARMNDETFRAFYAFSPQNTVGRILQIAIQGIHTHCPYIELLLNVHDEVVVQVLPEDVNRAIADIRKYMEIPLDIRGRTLIIPCDFKVGPSWGEMKEVG